MPDPKKLTPFQRLLLEERRRGTRPAAADATNVVPLRDTGTSFEEAGLGLAKELLIDAPLDTAKSLGKAAVNVALAGTPAQVPPPLRMDGWDYLNVATSGVGGMAAAAFKNPLRRALLRSRFGLPARRAMADAAENSLFAADFDRYGLRTFLDIESPPFPVKEASWDELPESVRAIHAKNFKAAHAPPRVYSLSDGVFDAPRYQVLPQEAGKSTFGDHMWGYPADLGMDVGGHATTNLGDGNFMLSDTYDFGSGFVAGHREYSHFVSKKLFPQRLHNAAEDALLGVPSSGLKGKVKDKVGAGVVRAREAAFKRLIGLMDDAGRPYLLTQRASPQYPAQYLPQYPHGLSDPSIPPMMPDINDYHVDSDIDNLHSFLFDKLKYHISAGDPVVPAGMTPQSFWPTWLKAHDAGPDVNDWAAMFEIDP